MFKRKPSTTSLPVPSHRVDYPEGVCVRTEKGHFYIGSAQRHPVKHQRVLDSWRFNVFASSEAAVRHLPIARRPLGFRAGTVVQNILDGKYYVISKNKKCPVANPDVLVNFGFNPLDALLVSNEEANLHVTGEVLN